MNIAKFFVVILVSSVAQAALEGPCFIPGVGSGACLHTRTCLDGGGGSFPGFCPDDPADVRCCFKRCHQQWSGTVSSD
ncbi:hypothetical protein CC2G_011125 [Coprinopsis cinerea AmutBmut pab1-1]|nr:hypothetical protein CC2G_011125 [Coprinopsis cinerea AmutBmut pab1-1]